MDALYINQDLIACGAIMALLERGVSIPEDVAVASHANKGAPIISPIPLSVVEIDVEASQVVDGKLLLQYSKGVRDDFNKDVKGNLAKADTNWPALVAKKGK